MFQVCIQEPLKNVILADEHLPAEPTNPQNVSFIYKITKHGNYILWLRFLDKYQQWIVTLTHTNFYQSK